MKIVYTQAAINDLEAIAINLLSHNPFVAENIADDVRSTIDRLSDFPFSGRRQDHEGVRKAISPRYRYKIFYIVDDGASSVFILSIMHPSRSSGDNN